MTANEIIIETLQYYLEDPSRRAVSTPAEAGKCKYLTEDGRRCAVGRCLVSNLEGVDLTTLITDVHGLNAELQDVLLGGLEGALKPEYRGHSIKLWTMLQQMHDDYALWRQEGPSGGYRALAKWLLVRAESAYDKAVELGLLPEVRHNPCEA